MFLDFIWRVKAWKNTPFHEKGETIVRHAMLDNRQGIKREHVTERRLFFKCFL